MLIGLGLLLTLILFLPFLLKKVEHNLEIFLFFMGIIAVYITGSFRLELFEHILSNDMLYLISGAVLVAGLLFKYTVSDIRRTMEYLAKKIPMPVIIFLLIVVLGFISSIITAIVASLVLVEAVNALPLGREDKVRINVVACFAIGLGAVLSPVGEPLATIVVSKMNGDFFFLFRLLGAYVIPAILVLGLFGAVYIGKNTRIVYKAKSVIMKAESYSEIVSRAIKIFLFIVALELLGAGFKPLVETYIAPMNGVLLYWVNIVSAVLDNATLAAAEISPAMGIGKLTAIMMGLLISGGMLIPGNIPNIISAGKLQIGSREWAAIGVPVGIIIMILCFIILFLL